MVIRVRLRIPRYVFENTHYIMETNRAGWPLVEKVALRLQLERARPEVVPVKQGNVFTPCGAKQLQEEPVWALAFSREQKVDFGRVPLGECRENVASSICRAIVPHDNLKRKARLLRERASIA